MFFVTYSFQCSVITLIFEVASCPEVKSTLALLFTPKRAWVQVPCTKAFVGGGGWGGYKRTAIAYFLVGSVLACINLLLT